MNGYWQKHSTAQCRPRFEKMKTTVPPRRSLKLLIDSLDEERRNPLASPLKIDYYFHFPSRTRRRWSRKAAETSAGANRRNNNKTEALFSPGRGDGLETPDGLRRGGCKGSRRCGYCPSVLQQKRCGKKIQMFFLTLPIIIEPLHNISTSPGSVAEMMRLQLWRHRNIPAWFSLYWTNNHMDAVVVVVNLHHRESTVGLGGFRTHWVTFSSSGNTASCVAVPKTNCVLRLSFFWAVGSECVSTVAPVARALNWEKVTKGDFGSLRSAKKPEHLGVWWKKKTCW